MVTVTPETNAGGLITLRRVSVQSPTLVTQPALCSSVFVAAEVSMASRWMLMSLAPGSSEITSVVPAP